MLVVSHVIVNCLLILVLSYVGLSTDLIKCVDGEQGDVDTKPIICEPNDDVTKSQDCSFIIVLKADDYQPINCLKIINQGNESVAGTPIVDSGGVGSTFILGEVFSEPGQGVNYSISVWSKPKHTTISPSTTTVQTTTPGGTTKMSINQVLIFCILGCYVLKYIVKIPNH